MLSGDSLRLGFTVLLKVFQRMGYFSAINTIPETVVKYLREQIPNIKNSTEFVYEHDSSFNRHRRRVYDYLKIKRYDDQIRSHAIKVAYNAQLKNEGHNIKKEDARFLSPYLTGHIKRYGDYIVDMSRVPKDITVSRSLVLW